MTIEVPGVVVDAVDEVGAVTPVSATGPAPINLPDWNAASRFLGAAYEDLLFSPPIEATEAAVIRAGGVASHYFIGDPGRQRAGIAAGRDAARYTADVSGGADNGGVVKFPAFGVLPIDQHTGVIRPIFAGDLTGAPSFSATAVLAGTQSVIVAFDTTSNQLSVIFGADGLQAAASLIVQAGDSVPVDGVHTVWWTWVASTRQLRLVLSNPVTGADVRMATTTASTGFVAAFKWPFRGEPRIDSGGIICGHDRSAGGTESGIAVEGPWLFRFARTTGAGGQKPAAAITVDVADVSDGPFRREVAGIVEHYTGWAQDEASEVLPEVRDEELRLLAEIGVPLVRIAEWSSRVTMTLSAVGGGTITAFDANDLIVHWLRWLDAYTARGRMLKIHGMVGYTPTALGGGTSKPALSGLTQAQAFTLYSKVWSRVLTDLAVGLAAHGHTLSDHLVSIGYWNEPINTSSGTNGWSVADHADLWQACAQRHAIDHPELPALGSVDGVQVSGGSDWDSLVNDAILARATGLGIDVGCMPVHAYTRLGTTAALEQVNGCVADAQAAGQSGFLALISETGLIGNYSSDPLQALSQERPQRQQGRWMAAWWHDYLCMAYDGGVYSVIFFRWGQQEPGYVAGTSEVMMAMVGSSGRPWPVCAAMEIWCLHPEGADRISVDTGGWDFLQAEGSRHPDSGVVTVSYSSFIGHGDGDEEVPRPFSWQGLLDDPAYTTFTWKRYEVQEGVGRAVVVARGDQGTLPSEVPLARRGVGAIQITRGTR
jgi:hypothetical protein